MGKTMHMSEKFTAALVLFTILSAVAFAQLFPPHQFYGSVTVNGGPAADGTTVSARINGVEIKTGTTKGGVYGKAPASNFFVESSDGRHEGRTVNFFVNGVDSGSTAIFSNGKSTEVNLVATISSPAPSGGGGGGGGGGSSGGSSGGDGGGGGGGTIQRQTIGNNNTESGGSCTNGVERWLCTDWSECKDGFETRTCEDINKCGTENDRPIETRPCSTVPTLEEKAAANQTSSGPILDYSFITAFATASPLNTGIIVIVLLGAAYLAWRIWKGKPKKK